MLFYINRERLDYRVVQVSDKSALGSRDDRGRKRFSPISHCTDTQSETDKSITTPISINLYMPLTYAYNTRQQAIEMLRAAGDTNLAPTRSFYKARIIDLALDESTRTC